MRMKPFVCEERCDIGCQMGCVVICKLGDWQLGNPVILLIVDENAKVLFEDLVDSFGLAVGLRMISSRQIHLDVEESTE